MIAIGSDHGGFALKQEIMKHLEERGLEYKDFGTYTAESCDYPQYGAAVGRAVAAGECERGILICGTGIGISISANAATTTPTSSPSARASSAPVSRSRSSIPSSTPRSRAADMPDASSR